jgi:hypothetical protein
MLLRLKRASILSIFVDAAEMRAITRVIPAVVEDRRVDTDIALMIF